MVGDPTGRRQLRLAPLLRSALVLYLLFPFLFLIFQFRLQSWPDGAELVWAFKNSFLQAFFSALAAVFFGWWSAMGLISLGKKRRHFRPLLEVCCLLPNFLPPLFILLATLNILDPFPMGIAGIALIHALINFGLVAVLLAGLIENKMGAYCELAYVEGAGQFFFLRKVFFPLMKRDLFMMFLFVFVICFGSFSIPLVVGGARGTTLEVLIYEKIRLSGNWGEAVILALLQSLFIFGLSFVAGKGRAVTGRPTSYMKLIYMPTGNLIILFCAGFLLMGYWQGVAEGLRHLGEFYEVQSAVGEALLGSLCIGWGVGFLSFALLMLIAYVEPAPLFERFLNGYVAPSTALACFSFLLLGPNESFWPFVKIPLAFVMITLNTLYRMGWQSRLQTLRRQREVAWLMGASRGRIFQEIVLPQIAPTAGLLAGLAAVWGTGDFAVSRILAHRDLSLAMMSQTLMSSYRLNMASALSALILMAGLACFVVFFWGGRVLSRKPSA